MTATPNPNRRRHALAPAGRAHRLVVSLAPADVDALASLAASWGCSQAEAVRRLVRTARVAPELAR